MLLDRGQELNWFQSRFIQAMAVTSLRQPGGADLAGTPPSAPRDQSAAVRDSKFLLCEFSDVRPGIRALWRGGVAPGICPGPDGLQRDDAGLVFSPGALAAVALMPVAGLLAARMDSRWLVGAGFLAAAAAFYHMTTLVWE